MPNRTSNPPWRIITLLLLAAIFAFGIAVAAIQPPFEGWDETAHFSRLQSQAFFSKTSAQNADNTADKRISKDVFEYYRRGPMPYQWIGFEGLHVQDPQRGYITYHDFFAQEPRQIEEYLKTYDQSPLLADYAPSPELNWQYQHPVLFYALMAQPMKFLAGYASLVTIFFVLRIICYLFAFAGFVIGLRATAKHLAATGVADAAVITALGALYPFLMPEFFWEFARLGNDSLCLLLFGIVWALFLWHLRVPRSDAWLYMGLAMGLGWLTKAIMIPVFATLTGLLMLRHIMKVRNSTDSKGWWQAPLKITGLEALIGAPVYLASFLHSGSVGALEFTAVAQNGNFWSLLQKNFAWDQIIYGLLGIFYTMVWIFGSWSRLVVNLPGHLPLHKLLYLFTAAIMLLYLVSLRRRPSVFRLPVWAITPVLIGLIAHLVAMLAKPGNPPTPGYYLHIMAPAFALIYGTALSLCAKNKISKITVIVFCIPIIAFNFLIGMSYMTAFSGCATPQLSDNDYLLNPSDTAACMSHFGSVIADLGILAWPKVALIGMATTFAFLTAAGILSFSSARKRGS